MFLQLPWTSSHRTTRARFASLILATGVATFSLMAPNVFGQKADNWTDSTGEKTVVAEFVKLEGVKLTLRRADGKEIVLPLSKLDDKSRLKARAMAKDAGDGASGRKPSSAKSREPVSFPPNPTAQEFVDVIIRELKDDNPIVIWDALPVSKQKEVEEVIKLASTRIEQKTLNLIKKFRGELLTTLKSKKQFVLNSKSIPIPPDQKPVLAESYDAIVGMMEAYIPIELMDVSYLQNSEVRDMLSSYLDNLASKAIVLQKSLPDDSPFKAMLMSKPQSASVENLSPNSANVTFVVQGESTAPFQLERSEGRWLPGIVLNWGQAMTNMKEGLESADPKQVHMKVGQVLLIANGLLGSIGTAETQEEFDERIVELMGMARMGGGIPAPAGAGF